MLVKMNNGSKEEFGPGEIDYVYANFDELFDE